MINTKDVLNGVTNRLFLRVFIIKNSMLDNWENKCFESIITKNSS